MHVRASCGGSATTEKPQRQIVRLFATAKACGVYVALCKGEMMTEERRSLHREWHQLTGEPMPEHIAERSIEDIRKAVKWKAKGCDVGFHDGQPAVEAVEDSLMDIDRQDEKNGNAYS